jgi:hypothetical protein
VSLAGRATASSGTSSSVFFLYITLAASAPLPEYSSSDVESFVARSDYDHDLLTRSLDFDSFETRELSFLRERDFDIGDGTYYKREFVTSDTAQLYRRTKITQKINAAFHKAGAAIKHGFQKAGVGIKKVAQKVGAGIKTAAKKVGTFIKNTGAKVVKFGLKVASAAAGVLSTVSRFIPGVGPGLSAAFKGYSAATNAASNAIHANLGKKLDKGMKVLNVIKDPIGAGISAAANKAKKHK